MEVMFNDPHHHVVKICSRCRIILSTCRCIARKEEIEVDPSSCGKCRNKKRIKVVK